MSVSTIAAEFPPKVRPALTQLSTQKNLGMVGGLLVRNPMFVSDASDDLARFKMLLAKLPGKSD
jgi:hypothetical protein